MEMRAYLSDYLSSAQKALGDMLDFAVNTCKFDIITFYDLFLVSDVSYQFQNGNATYLVGKTGCELAKQVMEDAGYPTEQYEDQMYLDKSPEYWAGWAIAFYQWYTCRSFSRMNRAVSIERIVEMYDVYHEMDIMHFVDTVNEIWDACYTETNLHRVRKWAGLSQRELADLSGVPLRQIQLFEQKQRDINRTKAIDVIRLGRVLGCAPEELLQI